MKRVLRFLIYLYPAWWRRRYGKELEALLEDAGPRWRDVWDLFRGAMEMQMSKWTFGAIVVACGIAGLALSTAVSFSIPLPYGSRAILKVPAGVQPSEAAQAALTPRSLTGIIIERNLYVRERRTMPIEDAVERMRRAIQVHPSGSDRMEVRFIDPDPSTAQHVTQTLAARFEGFEVLDPPSTPRRVGEGKRHVLAHVGLPAGLLLGVALALILRRRAPAAS